MFNCLDLASSVLLVLVILFRYLDRNEQWPCFSVGYLLWTFRTFKYAAVFRFVQPKPFVLVSVKNHFSDIQQGKCGKGE